jgi:hypothetical protein
MRPKKKTRKKTRSSTRINTSFIEELKFKVGVSSHGT